MQDIKNLEREVVMDTCYILQSCSTIGDKQRPIDGYSQIDEEVRKNNISPKEMRQEIEDLMIRNKLLISEIVFQELRGFLNQSCNKLNQKNKNRLSNLLQKFKGKIVEISIGVNEYKLQKEIFSLIEAVAIEKVEKIEKKTNSNLKGWENTNGHKFNPILKEVYKDPVCKTWQKICHFKNQVKNTALKAAVDIKNHKPFLLNDFLIILMAKKRKALIKTNDGDLKVILTAYNEIIKEKEMNKTNESHINR